ncbi:glycosyltransferase family 9 protein [Kutzneria kofuensis]|uniref:ADP-heptose:LPS heptosyltransferase n=1 Tax=Kutzneria kofuensis TaxID=103725 RepID=A0A7W9KR61_9PSEU|nr:glycosyltransferase family 9 protein [Kutzneria kofuensis]MBB5897191.1 ADP-heptose:LPS heptosyltransferase [Kutzneria kofuensis]
MRPFDDVHRIAILRGGGLGDLIFVLPAVHAVRNAYPGAEIVLLGTGQHARLLEGRPSPIDRVMRLPAAKGVYEPLPGVHDDPPALHRFFQAALAERFDLAFQLHGGGRWSNPFVRSLGARHTVGTRTPDAAPLARWLPYRYYQHEILRWLEVVALAGAPQVTLDAGLAVTDHDLTEAAEALSGLPGRLVTLHPGATDPRRRWPAEKYAEVAVHAVSQGHGVAVVGNGAESALVQEIVDRARSRSRSPMSIRGLAGVLDLNGLVGVLARSDVVVANDSGPRHMAEAIGTPTVSVFWCGNMINAGPFWRGVHRPHISWMVHCPVCGRWLTDQNVPDCGHRTPWVADVPVDGVLADVDEIMAATIPPQRGSRPVPEARSSPAG